MATAMSIEETEPPPSCGCPGAPDLAVRFVSVRGHDEKNQQISLAASARRQEIFFDWACIQAAHCDVGRFLLDERFDSSLDDDHRVLKQALRSMIQGLPESARKTSTFQKFRGILRDQMGMEDFFDHSDVRFYSLKRHEYDVSTDSFSASSENSDICNEESNDGHVFCINGSVYAVACDGFVCPTAFGNDCYMSGRIYFEWQQHVREHCPDFWDHMMAARKRDDTRFGMSCFLGKEKSGLTNVRPNTITMLPTKRHGPNKQVRTLRDWPWKQLERFEFPAPLPFLVAGNVLHWGDASATSHISSLEKTVRQCVDVCLDELKYHQPKPLYKRDRYLIAVPVLGTGGSGGMDLTGFVVAKLLEILQELASLHKIDFVLEAERLATLASGGHLSLFLGAGVSVGSGLPTWLEFLQILEDFFTPTGDPVERTLGTTYDWDFLAMADALEEISQQRPDRFHQTKSLKHRVCEVLKERSLAPGMLLYLLLSLSTKSLVTQNYDQMVEMAMTMRNIADRHSDETLSVIPYRPVRGASRWLLKMHGCVSEAEDIVFSGQDYKAYEAGRLRTLSGLVQANLITNHFLFVGFSLKDPNYLRILKEVRHALRPNLEEARSNKNPGTTKEDDFV